MPAEDMPTKSHLRRNKVLAETNAATKLLFCSKKNIFNFFPFSSFVEIHIPNLLMSSMRHVDNTT